jgi:serine/threonine-protein kinase HipA
LDRLACVGKLGMGALTYKPAIEPETDGEDVIDLSKLADDALGLIEGEEAKSLTMLQRLGGSSGGARPKVLVGLDGKGGLVPDALELP